jgi:hypothetical protein
VTLRDDKGPCPFPAADFATVAEVLREHGTLTFGGDAGEPVLTAEFPFYDDLPAVVTGRAGTALLTASAEERHPQLGSGVLLRLSLPDPPGAGSRELSHLSNIAHELNRAEACEWSASHFLGASCAHARQPVPGISFVTFLPAGVYVPGLLQAFILGTGVRARGAIRYLESRP